MSDADTPAVTLADVLARLDAIAARLDQHATPEARWLSVDGAAVYASLSDDSIRRLLSSGKLRSAPSEGQDRHRPRRIGCADPVVGPATAQGPRDSITDT